MKLLFSLFFLFLYCPPSFGLIRINYHPKSEAQANIVRNIFIQKYSIPKELIQNIQRNYGRDEIEDQNLVLDLFLNKKGELNILSINNMMLKESFKIFRQAHY